MDAKSHQTWTLRVVMVATALLMLNVAGPQVALEDIGNSIGASFSELQWVLSGYALSLAVLLLTAGSLADRFGRRKLFVGGLTLFAVASALCAVAPGPLALIATRIVQGVGAAVVFPSSLAILAEEFHGADRRRAIGVWGAVIGLSFAAGPLIGGVLVDVLGWRAVFAASALLGAPTIAFALRHVRETRDPDPPPIDWAGVGTLCAGLFLGVYAVLRGNEAGWTSGTVLGCLGGAVVLLAAFLLVEHRTPRPMLDLALFRNRTFTGATLVVFLLGGGTFAALVYVTLFLLDVQGRDPVSAGLVLAPFALVSFVVSAVAGRYSERVSLRVGLGTGMLVMAAGVVITRASLSADVSWAGLQPGLLITGAGVGLANPLVTFAHLGVLPPARGGLASALNNTARQIGLAVGIAVLGALLEASLDGGDRAQAYSDGVADLLLIAIVLSVAGAIAAFTLVRQHDLWTPEPQPEPAEPELEPV